MTFDKNTYTPDEGSFPDLASFSLDLENVHLNDKLFLGYALT